VPPSGIGLNELLGGDAEAPPPLVTMLPQRRSLGLARNAVARDVVKVMTRRVRQTQPAEAEGDDPLAVRSATSPAPTLADAANYPKKELCESTRDTT